MKQSSMKLGKSRDFIFVGVLACCLLGISGWLLPILDHWEIPGAEVSREMALTNRWFQPQLGFEAVELSLSPYLYWQAAWFKLLGVHVWSLRVPSFLLAIALGLSIVFVSRKYASPGASRTFPMLGFGSLPLLLVGVIGWPYLGCLLSFFWMCVHLIAMETGNQASKRESSAYLAGIFLGLSALQFQPGILWLGWMLYLGYLMLHRKWPGSFLHSLRFFAASLIIFFPFQLLPVLLSPQAAPDHWWQLLELTPIWRSLPELGAQFLWTLLLLGIGLPWHRFRISKAKPSPQSCRSLVYFSLAGGFLMCFLQDPMGEWLPIWPLPGMLVWISIQAKTTESEPLPLTGSMTIGVIQGAMILTACGWLSHSGAPDGIWGVGAGFLLWQSFMHWQTHQQSKPQFLLENGFHWVAACILIAWIFPTWAQQSAQAAPSYFFSRLPAQQTYVITEGYPSYLPHFLAQSLPPTKADPSWLTSGEVDREVFVVVDSSEYQTARFRREYLAFETLYQQDGFFFLRRKRTEPANLSLQIPR